MTQDIHKKWNYFNTRTPKPLSFIRWAVFSCLKIHYRWRGTYIKKFVHSKLGIKYKGKEHQQWKQIENNINIKRYR